MVGVRQEKLQPMCISVEITEDVIYDCATPKVKEYGSRALCGTPVLHDVLCNLHLGVTWNQDESAAN
jgi:hypothetical protein